MTPLAFAAFAALSAAAYRPLPAQGPPAGAGRGNPHTAVVSGRAIDSLHGGPLRGAQVAIDGTTRIGFSDSAGAFRIDSVPLGPHQLDLLHPLLDSLDVGVASPSITFGPGDSVGVVLATPSPATLIKSLCRGPVPPYDSGGGSSILIGRIVDAETDKPIPGARVALVWSDIVASRTIGVQHVERMRDTVTGPAGHFQFCWLPSNLVGTLHFARTYRGDILDRQFRMADRYLGIVGLHLPDSAIGTVGAVLEGRVVRTDGRSVPGARVGLVDGVDSTATATDGHFALRRLPTGSHTVVVRAVGYAPTTVPVELSIRQPQQVTVLLEQQTVVLKRVLVTAQLDAGYKRIGFDRRKAGGLGRYLSADEIARRGASELHDLLVDMPGMRVAGARDGTPYLVPTRGARCLTYVVDGHEFPQYRSHDVDDYVRPNAIGAIEVYQAGQVPDELLTGPSMGCAVVVVWTKIFLGVH